MPKINTDQHDLAKFGGFNGDSLIRAKHYVNENRADGVNCPCCGQLAKTYRRVINSGMARWLIALVQRAQREDRWFSVAEDWSRLINTGDMAKLAYWDLITRRPKDPADKHRKTSGLWRPTERGEKFARGLLSVPSFAVVYDGDLIKLEGDPVTIQGALGSRFKYTDLWKPADESR